ncbi:DNA helicase RecQ [Aerococcaceae bacterium DSM 111021]|nr:DNA helicase RecQ [Aerococcaceae bacterium DSM 111021]
MRLTSAVTTNDSSSNKGPFMLNYSSMKKITREEREYFVQLEASLQEHFGYSTFRPGQKDIINTILSGQDTVGILPTGGGKSVCYQLPALILPGLTVVISPLISLMKDQVDTLTQQGIQAAYLNSTISSEEFQDIIQQLRDRTLKMLYVAPERLENPSFQAFLSKQNISLFAVDEAHCVSQWGFDFRPSYRNITQFINQLPQRPRIAAFTATATKRVQEDIVAQLELEQPGVFINSFDRPNIKFTVLEPNNRLVTLHSLINHDEAIVIYASTRKQVDKLHLELKQQGYAVSKYHAGMEHNQRQHAQNEFINDESNIIVATNAFGMGIDKTDVRKVIHFNLPKDLESYYQEAGRAGRDSLDAEAILLYHSQDIMTNKFLIAQSNDELAHRRLEVMIQYASFTGCLRNFILRYFGEFPKDACGNCSNCLGEMKQIDVTKEAQMVLSCMLRMKHQFGMTMIIDVLRGSRNQKVLDNGFDSLSTYGIMKTYSVQQIRDIISSLLAYQYIGVTEHRGLFATEASKKLLMGEATLTIKERKYLQATTTSSTRSASKNVNQDLYEQLRQVRTQLAQEESMPAYIIFSNKSLEDMASKIPNNYEEFLQVEGVGSVKAEKYAGYFLPVIQEYTSANPSAKSQVATQEDESQRVASNRQSLSGQSSYSQSAKYAERGLTPYEIAIERGITESTVLSHLTQAAEQGDLEEFDADVSSYIKNQIKQAIRSVGTDSLKDIKEALPEKISYEDIKYVLIDYLVNNI